MSGGFDDFTFPLRLGFGCSGALAQSWFSQGDASRLIHTALDRGVRHFDTAGFYGDGEAERRLGDALAETLEPVFISTKVGTRYRLGGADKDFSEHGVRSSVEQSLARLRRDALDLVYLHGPSPGQHEEGLAALSNLKAEGKVRLAGICGEGAGLTLAAEDPEVDALMGVYNIFNRNNETAFEVARANKKGVVAIAPLAQGLYDPGFFRVRSLADAWRVLRAAVKNRRELDIARKARPVLTSVDGWSPAQLALAFVNASDVVDVAVTTSTKASHIIESTEVSGRWLPPDILQSLRDWRS